MRKVVIHEAGSYERLRIEQAPTPAPGPGEVLVETSAIGVNYADCMVRMGLYSSAKAYVGWPITPGFEVAGAVAALGEGVEDLAVGDRVFAVTRFDGYATHVRVGRRYVFRTPAGLTDEEAAGFPAVHLTAYFALFELAHPRPGAKVLVHSAAGGVGGALCQLLRIGECEVVGVVGASHKVDVATERGAHRVIDKSREDLWPAARALAPEGYDVILDANGVATLADSYRHLRAAGKLVVYGFHTMIPKQGGRPNWLRLARDYLRTPRFNPLDLTTDSKSVLAFNLSYLFERTDSLEEGMTRLWTWLEQGQLRPPKVTTYPLDDVACAHRDLESGQTVGKLVLVPEP